MDVLRRMRQAVRDDRYRISSHANEEMADDLLTASDIEIEHVIDTARVTRRLTEDPRGTRYEVASETLDHRRVSVLVVRGTAGHHSLRGARVVER